LAAILRMTPFLFLDDYIWVREGEQKVIPSTDGDYYIKNNRFILETYDEDDEKFQAAMEQKGELTHKNYQTHVVISKVVGEKITEGSIQMNKPLKFDGYTLYQSGFQENEFSSMTFKVYDVNDEDETSLGEVKVENLMSPEKTYTLDNGIEVHLNKYYPDYEMD